ncbi:MAG: hypothetical protein ACE5FQ_04700 [Thiogranum sp.]
MNVDTQLSQTPVAALPGRPLQTQAEPATARPVDKADKDEPSNNRTGPDARQTEAQKAAAGPQAETRANEQRADSGTPAGTFQANSRDPEPVGELLDVLA